MTSILKKINTLEKRIENFTTSEIRLNRVKKGKAKYTPKDLIKLEEYNNKLNALNEEYKQYFSQEKKQERKQIREEKQNKKIEQSNLLQESYTQKFKKAFQESLNKIGNEAPEMVKTDKKIMLGATISIKIYFSVSDEQKAERNLIIKYNSQIPANEYIYSEVLKYLLPIPEAFDIYYHISGIANPNIIKNNIQNKKNRAIKPLNLNNFFSNIVNLINPMGENCFKLYAKQIWKKMSPKTIDAIPENNGVEIKDIIEFCKGKNIKCIIYDIKGNILDKFIPTKSNKSFKSLFGVSFNGHFYPVENEYLEYTKDNIFKNTLLSKNDLQKKFRECVYNLEILPSNINFEYDNENNIVIKSFTNNKETFFYNEDYNKCHSILDKFGLNDRIYNSLNLVSISALIEPLYITKNIKSFFPYNFTKSQYCFSVKEVDESRNIVSIDKNKCYASILRDLEFLITCDIRTEQFNKFVNKFDIDGIKEENLYIACCDNHNLLIPEKNIYYGKHIIRSYPYLKKKNINIQIFEEFTCQKKENQFKNYINDLFKKCNPEDAKNIIVRMIGRMKTMPKTFFKNEVITLATEEETDFNEDTYIKYDDNYNFLTSSKEEIGDIYNKTPIQIQIKDDCYFMVFKKIDEIGIKNKDIIQINTDEISFYDDNNKFDNSFLNNDDDILKGWKINKKFTLKNFYPYKGNTENISFGNFEISNNNELFDMLAGGGKTHKILNEIITNYNNYIILTPSHSTIEIYRKKNIKCDVIQKYTLNNILPEEEIIIIDEIGMCDRSANDMIIKCTLMNKKIISLGDHYQLPPVGETNTFSNPIYLNGIYKKIDNTYKNWRNDFDPKFYKKIIADVYKDNKKELLEKYMCENWHDVDNEGVIIAYRNKAVDYYNALMIQKNGFYLKDMETYGNLKGAKIKCIAKKNCLKKYEMYTNFIYEIVEDDGYLITLNNGFTFCKNMVYNWFGKYLPKKEIDKKNNKICLITNESLCKQNKFFDFAYARTLYNVQGCEFTNMYFAHEDIEFLNNRALYTLISRLKGNINKELNEECEYIINHNFKNFKVEENIIDDDFCIDFE